MKKWLRLLISAIFTISGFILLYFIFLNPETSTTHYEDFSWVVKYFFSIALILILFYTAFFVLLIYKPAGNDDYFYDQEKEKEGTYDKLNDTIPIKVMNRWISGRGGDDFRKK